MVGTRLFENGPKVWNLGGLAPAPSVKSRGEVSKNSVPPLLGRFTKYRRKNSNNAGDDSTELTEGLGWSSHNNTSDPVIGDPNFDQLHFRMERQRRYSNEKCTTTSGVRKRRTRARKEENRGSLAPTDPFDLSGSTSSTSVTSPSVNIAKTSGLHGRRNKGRPPVEVERGTFMGWGEQSDHSSVLGMSSESDDCSDDDTEDGVDTCGWGTKPTERPNPRFGKEEEDRGNSSSLDTRTRSFPTSCAFNVQDCSTEEDSSEEGDLLVGFGGTTLRRSTVSSDSDVLLVGFGSRSDSPNPHRSRRQTVETEHPASYSSNDRNHAAEDEKSSSSRKRRPARRLSHTDKADILSELEHTMGSNLFASTRDVIPGSRSSSDDNPLMESFRRSSGDRSDLAASIIESFQRTSGDRGDLATSLLEDFSRKFVDNDDDDNEKPHESQLSSGPISPAPQSQPQHNMIGDDNPRHDQLMSQTTEELRLELQHLQHQSRANLEASWGDAEQYRVKISGLNDRMLHLKGEIFEAKMARESHTPSDSMHSGPVQTKLSDGPGFASLRRRTIDLSDSDNGSLGRQPSRGAFSLNDRGHATDTNNATWDDFKQDAHAMDVDFGGKDNLLSGFPKQNTTVLIKQGLADDDVIDAILQNDVMISTITIPSKPQGSWRDDENDEECDRSMMSGFGSTSGGPRQLSNEATDLDDYDFDPLMSIEPQSFAPEQLNKEGNPKRRDKPKRRPSLMKRSRSFSLRPGNLSKSLSRHNSFMNLNLFDASDYDDDSSSLSSSPNLDDMFGSSAGTLQARVEQKDNEIDRVESEIRCQKSDLRHVESELAQQRSETDEDTSKFKSMEATVRRQVEQVELQEMNTIAKLSVVETAKEEWREKEENLTDAITATNDALEEQHLIVDLEREYISMHRHVNASKNKTDMDAYDLLVDLRSLEIPSIRSGCEPVEDISCEALTMFNDLRTAQDDLVSFLTDRDRLPFFSHADSVNDNYQDLLRKHGGTENLGRDLRCHLTKLTNLIENDVEMSDVCTTTTDSSTSSERLSLEVAFIEVLLPLVEAGGRRGRMLLDALAMSDRLLTSWGSVLSPDNLDVRFSFSESLTRTSSSLQDVLKEGSVELSSYRSDIAHELDRFHSKLEDIGGASGLATINFDKFASKRKAGSSGRLAPECLKASSMFHEATKDIYQLTGQENEQGPDSIKQMLSDRQALLDSYAKFLELLKNQLRRASEDNLKRISGLELRLKEVCTKLSREDSPERG